MTAEVLTDWLTSLSENPECGLDPATLSKVTAGTATLKRLLPLFSKVEADIAMACCRAKSVQDPF